MSDIFDTLDGVSDAAPALDIFDQLEAPAPAGDVFDQIAPTKPEPVMAEPEGGSDLLRGAETAFRQIPQLAYGVTGLIGDTLGIDAVKDWGLRGYKEAEEKMQPLHRENDDVTKAWEKMKRGDIGAMADWAQYGVGYALGQFAESVAVAGIGAAAGGAMGAPAAGVGAAPGAVGGAVTGIFGKQAVKTAAKAAVEKVIGAQARKIAIKELGKDAAEDAILKKATSDAVRKQAGKRVGMIIASGGNALGMELGSIYPEAIAQAEKEGRDLTGSDLARVWGSGIVAGGMEGVADILQIDLVTKKFKDLLPDWRMASAAVAGLAGVGVEATTEFVQTGIERFGAGKEVTGPEAVNEYINAAALGGLGGGVIGGGGGFISGGSAKPAAEQAAATLQANNLPQTAQQLAAVMGVDNLPASVATPPAAPTLTDSKGSTIPTAAADMPALAEVAFGPSVPEREYDPDILQPEQILLRPAPKGFSNLDVVWYDDLQGGQLPTTRAYNRATSEFETMTPEAQAAVVRAYPGDITRLKDPANLTRAKKAESPATLQEVTEPEAEVVPEAPAALKAKTYEEMTIEELEVREKEVAKLVNDTALEDQSVASNRDTAEVAQRALDSLRRVKAEKQAAETTFTDAELVAQSTWMKQPGEPANPEAVALRQKARAVLVERGQWDDANNQPSAELLSTTASVPSKGGGKTENVPTPEEVVASTQEEAPAAESKPEPELTPEPEASAVAETLEEKRARRKAGIVKVDTAPPLATSQKPAKTPPPLLNPAGKLNHRAFQSALKPSKAAGEPKGYFETTDNPEDFKKLPRNQTFPYDIGTTLFTYNDKGEVQAAWRITNKQPTGEGQERVFVDQVNLSQTGTAEAALKPVTAIYEPNAGLLADAKEFTAALAASIRNGGFNDGFVEQMKALVKAQFGIIASPAFTKDHVTETTEEIFMDAGVDDTGRADIRYNPRTLAKWAFDKVAAIPSDNLVGIEFAARDILQTLAQMGYEELGHTATLPLISNEELVPLMSDMDELADENPVIRAEVIKHSRWVLGVDGQQMTDDQVVVWFQDNDTNMVRAGHEMFASLLARVTTGKDPALMHRQFERYILSLTQDGAPTGRLQNLINRITELVNRLLEGVASFYSTHQTLRQLPAGITAKLEAMEALMDEQGFKAPDIENIPQKAIARNTAQLAGAGRFAKESLRYVNAQTQLRDLVTQARKDSGDATLMPFMLVGGKLELTPNAPLQPEVAVQMAALLEELNTTTRVDFVTALQGAQDDLNLVMKRRNNGRTVASLTTQRKNGKSVTEMAADTRQFISEAFASLQRALGDLSVDQMLDQVNGKLASLRDAAFTVRSVNGVDSEIRSTLFSAQAEPEIGRVLDAQTEARAAMDKHLSVMPSEEDDARGPWEGEWTLLDKKLTKVAEQYNALIARRSLDESEVGRSLRALSMERRQRATESLQSFARNRSVYGPIRNATELISRHQEFPFEIGGVLRDLGFTSTRADRVIDSLTSSAQILDAAYRLRDFSGELNYLLLGGREPRSLSRWSRQWQAINFQPTRQLSLTPFQIAPQILAPSDNMFETSQDRILQRTPGFPASITVPLEVGELAINIPATNAFITMSGELGADGVHIPEAMYNTVLDGMAREVNNGSQNVMRMLGIDPLGGLVLDETGAPFVTGDKVQLMTANANAVGADAVTSLLEARWMGSPEVTHEHTTTAGFSLEYAFDMSGKASPILQEQLFEMPDTSILDFGMDHSLVDSGFAGQVIMEAFNFMANHNANQAGRSTPLLTHPGGITPLGLVMQLVGPKLMRLLALTKGLVAPPWEGQLARPSFSDAIVAAHPEARVAYDRLADRFELQTAFDTRRLELSKNPYLFQTEFWELYHLMKAGNSVYRTAMREVKDKSGDRQTLSATAAEMPLDAEAMSDMKYRLDQARWWSSHFNRDPQDKTFASLLTPVRAWPLIQQYLSLINEQKSVASEEFDASIQRLELDEMTAGQELRESKRESDIKRRLDVWRTEAAGALLGGDQDAMMDLMNDEQFAITITDAEGNAVRGYAEEKINSYLLDWLYRGHREDQARGIVLGEDGQTSFDTAIRAIAAKPENLRHRATLRSITETGGFVQTNRGQADLVNSAQFEADTHSVLNGIAALIPGLTVIEGNAPWEGSLDDASIPENPKFKTDSLWAEMLEKNYGKSLDDAIVEMKAAQADAVRDKKAGIKSDAGDRAAALVEIVATKTRDRGTFSNIANKWAGVSSNRGMQGTPSSDAEGMRKPPISFIPDSSSPMLVMPYGTAVGIGDTEAREALVAMIEWLGTNGSVDTVGQAQAIVDAIAPQRVHSNALASVIRQRLEVAYTESGQDITEEQDAQIHTATQAWLDVVANGALASADKMGDSASIFFTPGRHSETINPNAAARIIALALTQPHAKKAIALAMKDDPGGAPPTDTELGVYGVLMSAATLPGIGEQIVADQLGAQPQLQVRDENSASWGEDGFEDTAHIAALKGMVEGTDVPYDEDGKFLQGLSEMGASPVVDVQVGWGRQLLINTIRGLNPTFTKAPAGLIGKPIPTNRPISEFMARQLIAVMPESSLRNAVLESREEGGVGWNGAGAQSVTAGDLMNVSGDIAARLVEDYNNVIPFRKGNTFQEDIAFTKGTYSFGDLGSYDTSHSGQYHKDRIGKGMIYWATRDFPGSIREVGENGKEVVTADASDLNAIQQRRKELGYEMKLPVQRTRGGEKLFASRDGRELVESEVVQVQVDNLAEGLEFLSGESAQDHLVKRTIAWAARDGSGRVDPVMDEMDSIQWAKDEHAREKAESAAEVAMLKREAIAREAELNALRTKLTELDQLEGELLQSRNQEHFVQILGKAGIKLDSTWIDANPILKLLAEDPDQLVGKIADAVVGEFTVQGDAWKRSVSLLRLVSNPEDGMQRATRGGSPEGMQGPARAALDQVAKERKGLRQTIVGRINTTRQKFTQLHDQLQQDLIDADLVAQASGAQAIPQRTLPSSAELKDLRRQEAEELTTLKEELDAFDAESQKGPTTFAPARQRLTSTQLQLSQTAEQAENEIKPLVNAMFQARREIARLDAMVNLDFDIDRGDADVIDGENASLLEAQRKTEQHLSELVASYNAVVDRVAKKANAVLLGMVQPAFHYTSPETGINNSHKAFWRILQKMQGGQRAIYDLGLAALSRQAAEESQWVDVSGGLSSFDLGPTETNHRIDIPFNVRKQIAAILRGGGIETEMRAQIAEVLRGELFPAESRANAAVTALRARMVEQMEKREIGMTDAMEVFRVADGMEELDGLDPLVKHRLTLGVARSILEGRIATETTTVQRLVSDAAKEQLSYKRRQNSVFASRHQGPTKLEFVGPAENISILRKAYERDAERWSEGYMNKVGKTRFLSGLADSLAAQDETDQSLLDSTAAQAMEIITSEPYEVVVGGIAPVASTQASPSAVEQPAQKSGGPSPMRTDTPMKARGEFSENEWEVGQSLRAQLLEETRQKLGRPPSGKSATSAPAPKTKFKGRLRTAGIYPTVQPNATAPLGERVLAAMKKFGEPVDVDGPMSAAMEKFDSRKSFSADVKAQVMWIVEAHHLGIMKGVMNPLGDGTEGDLHSRMETFLNAASVQFEHKHLKELFILENEVKRELRADSSVAALEDGFVPSEALSSSVVKNLLNLDPTIRAAFAAKLEGINAAEGLLGILEFGSNGFGGRTGTQIQSDEWAKRFTEEENKIAAVGRLEKTSAGFMFQQVQEYLKATNANRSDRAEGLLRMLSQAEDGISSALSRGMVHTHGAPSIAATLALPLKQLRKVAKSIQSYYGEETYRLLEERGVARDLFRKWEGRLRAIADNADNYDPVMAEAKKEMGSEAEAWGDFVYDSLLHERDIYISQAKMMGVVGSEDWDNKPVVPFRWQVFGRTYDPADDLVTTADRIAMDRTMWMAPANRNLKPGEIHMLDVNGMTAPLQILNDMIYRRNMAPAYHAFSQVVGEAQHVGKVLQTINFGHAERIADARLGEEKGKRARAAIRYLAIQGQGIIEKDRAERAPRNRMMDLVQKLQQQGAVRALISAKQIWSQTIPGMTSYVFIRDGFGANLGFIPLYLKYLHGVTTAHVTGDTASKAFAKNVNDFVRRKGRNVYRRTADGNADHLDNISRVKPRKESLPEGRVTGRFRPIADAVTAPVRVTHETAARASSAMLRAVLAVPESTVARMIFVHNLLKSVNQGKAPADQVTAEQLVEPNALVADSLTPKMLRDGEMAVTDMMAVTDPGKKAKIHQQSTSAWGEFWRGWLSTFANHQMHTSGNSLAGWRMAWFGKDAATKKEGLRLVATNASQNIIFQIFRYETLGMVLIAGLATLFDWDEDEEKEAYGRLYGITPGMSPEDRNRTVMRWVSLIGGGSPNPIGYSEKTGEWDEEEKAKDLKQMALMVSKELVNQVPFGGVGLVASTAAGSTLNEYLLKKTVMELIPGELGVYKRAGLVVPERWGGDGQGPNSESAVQRAIYGASQVFLNDISSRSTLTGGITSLVDPVVHIGNSPEEVGIMDSTRFWMSQFPALPRELRRVINSPAVENTGTQLWDGQIR